MSFIVSMDVSGSGLAAQRARLDVAASNLANVSTTRTEEGGPYRRRDVVLASQDSADPFAPAAGVRVEEIRQDLSPPRLEYDPGHPDANADGFVALPNVNVVEEMVDMITASRAYEAGVNAMNTTATMVEQALRIGR